MAVQNRTFKVFLSSTDSRSWLSFLLCQSLSQCSSLKLTEQLVEFSSKLICFKATFPNAFTPFSSFINLIAQSLISLRLSPSTVLWPVPEGSAVKVSQTISAQLIYCPWPDMTSAASHWIFPLCSRATGQSEAFIGEVILVYKCFTFEFSNYIYIYLNQPCTLHSVRDLG